MLLCWQCLETLPTSIDTWFDNIGLCWNFVPSWCIVIQGNHLYCFFIFDRFKIAGFDFERSKDFKLKNRNL